MTIKTPIEVQRGAWRGNLWRRARKAGRCDYWRGLELGRCGEVINPGDLYLEGERNDDAGGYGAERYCIGCAGDEAREVLAHREQPEESQS